MWRTGTDEIRVHPSPIRPIRVPLVHGFPRISWASRLARLCLPPTTEGPPAAPQYVFSVVAPVPEGQSKIAQRFIAGIGWNDGRSSPGGTADCAGLKSTDMREAGSGPASSIVPPGRRAGRCIGHPAMNRWAIVGRPSGTWSTDVARQRAEHVLCRKAFGSLAAIGNKPARLCLETK